MDLSPRAHRSAHEYRVEIPYTSLNYFDNHYRIVEIMVGVKRRLTLILLGTIVSLSSIAQIDSLEAVIKSTDSDSIRVRAYLALSTAYQFQNYAKAKSNSAHAMDIAEREDWEWALYQSYKQEAL